MLRKTVSDYYFKGRISQFQNVYVYGVGLCYVVCIYLTTHNLIEPNLNTY